MSQRGLSLVLTAGALMAILVRHSIDAQVARDVPPAPAVASLAVSGRVMSDEPASRPVRRAIVALTHGEDGTASGAVTDDDGRFVVRALRPGRYTATVTKDGWVTTVYGATRPGRAPGVAIAVGDGRPIPPLDVRMLRGAVIAGRIVDERGSPLVNAEPRLMEMRTIAGQQRIQPVTALRQGRLTTTDDRGEYRFFGLAPGTYFVQAGLVSGGAEGVSFGPVTMSSSISARGAVDSPVRRFVPTYYANATDAAEAVPIVVGPGEERTNVDFAVRAERASRIEGRLVGPEGLGVSGTTIFAEPVSRVAGPLDWGRRAIGTSDREGVFLIATLAPGRYRLTAQSGGAIAAAAADPAATAASALPATTRDLWAATEIAVTGQDQSGVTLQLRPGQSVAGRVVYESSRPSAAAPWPRLWTWGDDPDAPLASPAAVLRPGSDGRFATAGIRPGRYAVGLGPASEGSSWSVLSARAAGRDLLTSGVEITADSGVSDLAITVTDRGGELTGRLLDRLGRPAPEYFVFAFPVERGAWHRYSARLKPPVRPGTDGRYRIAPLPPGAYFVVALTASDELDYLDPAFLDPLLPGAIRVSIGDRDQHVQDIQLAGP